MIDLTQDCFKNYDFQRILLKMPANVVVGQDNACTCLFLKIISGATSTGLVQLSILVFCTQCFKV